MAQYIIWIYFSENARNVHMSASKCFSLSTKNNSETCVCLQFAGKRAILYIPHRNSVKHRKPAQFLLINRQLFENARITHTFAYIYFLLSTKNNIEEASARMQMLNVKCIISNTLHRNSAKHKKSAQFLLINHKLFKTTRNVLMPASKYFTLSTKNNRETAFACFACNLSVLY